MSRPVAHVRPYVGCSVAVSESSVFPGKFLVELHDEAVILSRADAAQLMGALAAQLGAGEPMVINLVETFSADPGPR